MIKIWNALKGQVEWIYLTVFSVLAILEALNHDWPSALLDFALGSLLFALYGWWFPNARKKPSGGAVPPHSPPEDAMQVILSGGYESVSDGLDLEAHQRLNPDCKLCALENND